MDSNNKNSKMKEVFGFLLKLVKLVGGMFKGMKCKSVCCNSECMNKKECTINVPQDQKLVELE